MKLLGACSDAGLFSGSGLQFEIDCLRFLASASVGSLQTQITNNIYQLLSPRQMEHLKVT